MGWSLRFTRTCSFVTVAGGSAPGPYGVRSAGPGALFITGRAVAPVRCMGTIRRCMVPMQVGRSAPLPASKRGAGVDDEIEEVRRVTEALGAIDHIADLEQRVRARNRVLAAQAEVMEDWHKERRDLVKAMRDQDPPVPIRKIAQRLEMSPGVVQDIIRGHTGSWKNREKKDKAKPAE